MHVEGAATTGENHGSDPERTRYRSELRESAGEDINGNEKQCGEEYGGSASCVMRGIGNSERGKVPWVGEDAQRRMEAGWLLG